MSSTSSFNMNQYLDSRNIVQKPGQPIQLSTEHSSHHRPLYMKTDSQIEVNPQIQSQLQSKNCGSTGFETTHLCQS